MFIKTFQKCSFLSIPQVKWWWHVEGVKMEVNAKIELLAGLECIATKSHDNLENYHLIIQKQLSRVACWFCFRWNWNGPLTFDLILGLLTWSYLFGLIRPFNVVIFDLKQTSLTSRSMVIYCVVLVCTAFDSILFDSIFYIRSFINSV